MANWIDSLGIVERNVYGFVLRRIGTSAHLLNEVIDRKLFIFSEVEIIYERNNFHLSELRPDEK